MMPGMTKLRLQAHEQTGSCAVHEPHDAQVQQGMTVMREHLLPDGFVTPDGANVQSLGHLHSLPLPLRHRHGAGTSPAGASPPPLHLPALRQTNPADVPEIPDIKHEPPPRLPQETEHPL